MRLYRTSGQINGRMAQGERRLAKTRRFNPRLCIVTGRIPYGLSWLSNSYRQGSGARPAEPKSCISKVRTRSCIDGGFALDGNRKLASQEISQGRGACGYRNSLLEKGRHILAGKRRKAHSTPVRIQGRKKA